jgi:hypothetical protein
MHVFWHHLCHGVFFFFSSSSSYLTEQLYSGLRRIIVEVSRSHTDTLRSVEFLWTRDRPVAETSTWQQTTLTTDRHQCPRWYSNPQSQQASDTGPRFRPRNGSDAITFNQMLCRTYSEILVTENEERDWGLLIFQLRITAKCTCGVRYWTNFRAISLAMTISERKHSGSCAFSFITSIPTCSGPAY